MIKAAFFDIDGTLVSFKTHRMPALTRRALAELHRRGIKCAIATGRSDHKLPVEVTEPFDGFPGFDAFLTFTGSLCYDDRGVYRDTPLARKDVEKIVELVEAGAFEVIMVCRDHDFASRLSPEVLQSGANANIAFETGDVRQALGEDVYQVNAFVSPSASTRLPTSRTASSRRVGATFSATSCRAGEASPPASRRRSTAGGSTAPRRWRSGTAATMRRC